jgi:hypothetical protein
MNAPLTKDDRNDSVAPIFEPFPEPQTMPKGWDFSGILSAPVPATAQPAGDVAEA